MMFKLYLIDEGVEVFLILLLDKASCSQNYKSDPSPGQPHH